ncbi:MAG: D-tyrosyl-tRNA(Tyr) deacylase [Sedimentisphaerales bacterium]|nr:D-tyrosyl-tRNA(Tyr) deacylase [Sedimentisphaerales bacterium]
MRAVVQRVRDAKVEVDGQVTGAIEKGLLVYLGVGKGDTQKDMEFIAEKVMGLRIYEDQEGRMNRSVRDVGGGVLLISQFTLFGDCRKGRRPSFDAAADPETADALYRQCAAYLRAAGMQVGTGVFAAHMHVTATNDGPVTLLLDSKQKRGAEPFSS